MYDPFSVPLMCEDISKPDVEGLELHCDTVNKNGDVDSGPNGANGDHHNGDNPKKPEGKKAQVNEAYEGTTDQSNESDIAPARDIVVPGTNPMQERPKVYNPGFVRSAWDNFVGFFKKKK